MTLASFFAYSFIGWIIDTFFRSIAAGQFTVGNVLPLPLCPVYGIGALLVLMLGRAFKSTHLLVQGALFGLTLAITEYIAGILILKATGERSWLYEGGVLSLGGFTDLQHALWWGAAALVLVHILHPYLLGLSRRGEAGVVQYWRVFHGR